MKILLICSGGMSTSLIVQKMEKVADSGDVIEAKSLREIEKAINEFDVVLLGPQIRNAYGRVKKLADEYKKPIEMIDSIAYGRFNSNAIYKQAKDLYEKGWS